MNRAGKTQEQAIFISKGEEPMKLMKTIPIFLMLLTVFSFAGCSNGISGKEAKEHIPASPLLIITAPFKAPSTLST